MDEPWFRKWLWFGYRPIRWQGWLLTITTAILLPATGFLALAAENNDSAFGLASICLFIAIGIGFHAVVLWKMERRYG